MWRLIEANNTCNGDAFSRLERTRMFNRGPSSDPAFNEIYDKSHRIREKMNVLLQIYRAEKRYDAQHGDSLETDMEKLKRLIPEYYGRAYCMRHLDHSGWQTVKPGDSPELALSRQHTNMTLLFNNLKDADSFGDNLGSYLQTHYTKPKFISGPEADGFYLYSVQPVPMAEVVQLSSIRDTRLLEYDSVRGLLKFRKSASRSVLHFNLFDNQNHCHYEMDYIF